MGEQTAISWCHHTFNTHWGCEKVSPACDHCYAESTAKRYGHDIWGKGSDRRFFGDKHWAEPLKWDRKAAEDGVRRRVFCSSMADVFENRDDLDAVRSRLWDLIIETPHLDWLLLTKRPDRVLRMVPRSWVNPPFDDPIQPVQWPSNAWVGTTVESQRYAFRLDHLVQVPAPVRFVSAEPLLGPLDLDGWLPVRYQTVYDLDLNNGHFDVDTSSAVTWCIVGGESGPGARRMDPAWALTLLDQCERAGVDGWFKQAGSVLARELGVPGKGADLALLPEAYRVQKVPEPCG